MEMILTYSAVLLIFLISFFLIVQSMTLFWDQYYPITVGWLIAIGMTSLAFSISSASSLSSPFNFIFAVIGSSLTIVVTCIILLKLSIGDGWGQTPRKGLRKRIPLDLPHEEFSLLTSDGIVIRGHHAHILPDHKLRPSVIIIAHGGLRSKDMFVKSLLTAWLVKHFDVMSFDFRGHGESGGAWTGDGKTVVDLKAVIDFARQKGYQKVGVFGRSMGGWTAVLEAVDYHDVDAIVLAGMPPGFFTEVPLFYGLIEMLRYPGAPFLLRLVRGIRYKYFENIRSPIKEIGKVAPVPLLILYNEADPGAGVAGVPGYWESIPPKSRELTFRRIRSLPFTAQQIYEAACPPKELQLLPGAAHVYSLMALRSLFDCVELWFQHHLGGDETSEYV